MDTRKIKEEYTRNNLHREARILGQIRHPNIIRLYETLKVSLFIFHRRDHLRNQYVSYAFSQAKGTKFTLFHTFHSRILKPRILKVSKGARIRNRYNQVPYLTQDTNGKVTNSQLYTTNESQEVSPFQAVDHKAQINRHAQRHNKHKAEKSIKDPQKKYRLGTVSKIFY